MTTDRTAATATGINHYLVAESQCTCESCPEQWNGRLTDGQHFYFRLRPGQAQLGIGATADDAVLQTVIDGDDAATEPYGDLMLGSFESAADRDAFFAILLHRITGQEFAGYVAAQLEAAYRQRFDELTGWGQADVGPVGD